MSRLVRPLLTLSPPRLSLMLFSGSDDVDDYLEGVKTETRRDESFEEYLHWLQSQYTENPVYQLPEDWIRQLCTFRFSNLLAALNLRSSLILKEVDYLVLAKDDSRDFIYLITLSPNALRIVE
jgi:hypothetical protein